MIDSQSALKRSDSHSLTNSVTSTSVGGSVPQAAAPDDKQDWNWLPIRSLGDRQRIRVTTHLIGLGERDRYLRFGHPVTDAQIGRYVDSIDFEADEVFGVFNRRLDLIAMAHLAHPRASNPESGPRMAEFGVSVSESVRGRGFGRRLFERAVLSSRNRGVKRLLVNALSENTAILKIARRAGAVVERDGSEAQAWLTLPPDTLASQVGEIVERQAAELDYQFKRRARQVNALLEVIHEVRTHTGRSGHAAEE